MSDITIPGVTSKFNSQKIVDDLMELERIPLTRMEGDVSTYNDQKKVWQELNRNFTTLRESSKSLYGFQNPFNDRSVSTSDENAITASATRAAQIGETRIDIIELAQADRFLSKSLPENYEVPAGDYRFMVGEEEISFSFRGGSLKKFADTLNRKDDELLVAKIVKDTADSQVILLESRKEGLENTLLLLDKASDFGIDTGIVEKTIENTRDIDLTDKSLKKWTIPVDRDLVTVESGTLLLKSGSEVSVPLKPAFNVEENIVLELEYNVRFLTDEVWQPPSPPPGPEIPEVGGVSLEGVRVMGASSKVILPEWEEPIPPERVDDMNFLFAQEGGKSIPLPELQDTGGFIKLQVNLAEYTDKLSALNIRNRNTYREIEIRNIRLYDPLSRGEFKPLRAVSRAQDAKIEFEGIEIKRSSNTIDDLIPGVTLNLKEVPDRPVTLTVEPDRETVKDSIIELVGNYNRILTSINILTRANTDIIDEIEYFTDEEREKAEEQLGLFQGDITLNQLRNSLQSIMMNAYVTEEGRDFSLLAHMGISTNAGGVGRNTGIDATRLRGYLEIDEEQLDAALENHFSSVKELFGRDSDGDLIIDSGVAFAVDNQIQPFVQTGGLFSMKVSTLDSQIDRTNREIDNYNRYLERYEQDLRTKYGMMEGAIESLEQSSQAIDNFNRNTNSY